jgi:hypothetical protein
MTFGARSLCLAAVSLSLGCSSRSARSPEQGPERRSVMTWVAPYAVAKSKARLDESFGGVGMKDGITDLGLQFWEPVADGNGLRRSERGDTSDAVVLELRDWGRARGVRVSLCVYNYDTTTESWNWPWARSAFATHRKAFVAALIAELDRLDLDGIDLDLEGNGALDADKAAYLEFVRELSPLVRTRKKRLTIDSFAYIWHAPNQTWWSDLFPLVDGINSMGYEEIGAGAGSGAESWRSFSAQEDAAGDDVSKLTLGMPASLPEWRGKTALEQLRAARDRGHAGVSIWDSQLDNPAWRTRDVWQTIAEIKGGKLSR